MPDVKFSNLYPYTDFHELNLDWVIKEVKYWSTRVGKTIQSIELTGTVGLVDTYTITYSDGTTSTFDVTNGNGIVSVAKTGTAGLVDTYTITLTDGSSSTFEVHNGTASIDPTLTLSGYAADAKVTGDYLREYLLDNVSWVYPTNWFNNAGLVAGELKADGTILASTARKYTDYFIPVTPGLYVYYNRGDNFGAAYMRHMACYDSSYNIIPSAGTDSTNVAYLIQAGVAYVKITIDNPNLGVLPMITVSASAPTVYTPYFDPYFVFDKNYVTPAADAALVKIENRTFGTSDLANQYAAAIPRHKNRQTVGLSQKWYKMSMVTPVTDYIMVAIGTAYCIFENDGVSFPNTAAMTSVNGYTWDWYDVLMNRIDGSTGYGNPRNIMTENLANCSAIVIGDSTVAQNVMTQSLLDHFTSQSKTLTLFGTLGSGTNKHEGRAGWSAKDYCTMAIRSGVTNPFYNSVTQSFDFSYYMTNQGYSTPDFVIVQLGLNDLGTSDTIETTWSYLEQIINSIIAFSSSIKIIIDLPNTCSTDQSQLTVYEFSFRNKEIRYNALAIDNIVSQYGDSKVRASYCHLILDPSTDIRDNVHPTDAGYNKMALEIANQINHWQNGD